MEGLQGIARFEVLDKRLHRDSSTVKHRRSAQAVRRSCDQRFAYSHIWLLGWLKLPERIALPQPWEKYTAVAFSVDRTSTASPRYPPPRPRQAPGWSRRSRPRRRGPAAGGGSPSRG